MTRGFYHDEAPVWPDGVYPWRFAFEKLDEQSDVHLSIESFPTELVDAVRNSAIAAGSPPRLAYLTGFGPWAQKAPAATPLPAVVVNPDAIVREFAAALAKSGITFGAEAHVDVARGFVTALMAKPFVILTGAERIWKDANRRKARRVVWGRRRRREALLSHPGSTRLDGS